jgi:tetratricopeptide (TPR) repeat protein
MLKQTRIVVFSLVAALPISGAMADVITLKDGARLEGDVKKNDGGWTVTAKDGKVLTVPAEQVKSISVGGSGAGPTGKDAAAEGMSGLLSLRRSVENVSDLRQIIDRFKKFIGSHKETPAALEAQQDLAMWQERLDRGLVKHGTHWVTADAHSKMADRAQELAAQARDLVQHGLVQDADLILQQALGADPQCVPALYLRGVVLYQQNKIPDARKMFEGVNGITSDHAPTLNNLGVILWRQSAQGQALSYYDKSITAAPGDKFILDNIAAALAGVSDGQRKSKIWEALHRKFTEQDAHLQELMAAEGWYRWGTAWIDEAAMQKIRDKQNEIDDQIAAVLESVKNEREELRQVDDRLASVQERIHRIFMNTPVPFKGPWIRMPFPPVYFELQEEEAGLKFQRAGLVPKVDAADAQVERLRSQLPQPSFAGTQKVIGVEGTPMTEVDSSESPDTPVPALTRMPTRAPGTAPSKN